MENGKPAPDLFLKAAEQLKVDPRRCRGFEDADLGIQALRAAGFMDAVDVRVLAGHPYRKLEKEWGAPRQEGEQSSKL